MNKPKPNAPRWLHRLYAFLNAYYWGRCPLCHRMCGGHETSVHLMTGWNSGVGVCGRCADEAKRQNDEWMARTPRPVIHID